jgi:hypothetical protein
MNFHNYTFFQMHYNINMNTPSTLNYLNSVSELLHVPLIEFIIDIFLIVQQFYINKLYSY